MEEFLAEFAWEREVTCYCKLKRVVTRRPPAFDRYTVCSKGCWDKMVSEGKHEPGSLYREWARKNDIEVRTS